MSNFLSITNLFQESSQPDGVNKFLDHAMEQDLNRHKKLQSRKTGFPNIDKKTNLFPGLYVIGAIPSLGKTTFIHQMSDQLASAGDHVLYFIYEQSRLELATKGISRITAQHSFSNNFKTAVQAIDIRNGMMTDAVKEAMKEYSEAAKTESVIECRLDTKIDWVVDYVNTYMQVNKGIKPIVIIDYLQAVEPSSPRLTAKDAVDANVSVLKTFQRDNELVVIAICSLNRQNYLSPVDFEGFKESGGIENTADVVWGMQLATMSDPAFINEKDARKLRKMVRRAKLQEPREIELVCLKNRNGLSSYTCYFNYYPLYDLFIPTDNFHGISEESLFEKYGGRCKRL